MKSPLWMRQFRPDFDVFAGHPVVVCGCGWTWDAREGADTLLAAVTACAEHAGSGACPLASSNGGSDV